MQLLEAAATAISLIEVRDISPPSEQAKLFWSEPQTGFTSGLPTKAPKPEPINHWQRAVQATFAKEGIPPEFLSHYEPDRPFAACRIVEPFRVVMLNRIMCGLTSMCAARSVIKLAFEVAL